MEAVALSSSITKIIRSILIMTILLNSLGIFFIKFLIPKEKAITYNLSLNFALILISSFIFIISWNLVNVVFDKTNKKLIVKRFRKVNTIKSSDILKVEKVFPFKCRITYKSNNIQKNILFIPKILAFSPLSNYSDAITNLIKK